MYAVGSEVYIYHNSQLITAHTVAECKLNYTENRYKKPSNFLSGVAIDY